MYEDGWNATKSWSWHWLDNRQETWIYFINVAMLDKDGNEC